MTPEILTSLSWAILFPVIMILIGRKIAMNTEGNRKEVCFGIPKAGKSQENQGLVNEYGGQALVRWSVAAILVFVLLTIIISLIPIDSSLRTHLLGMSSLSSLICLGSILETAWWSRKLP